MFVYIWKHNETPFYVGMSNSRRRADPTVSNPRGWFCKQKLAEIGAKNVVVEIHTKDTVEEAQLLERSLIEKYGRIQLNTGTLTNLRRGGEGRKNMSEKEKTALSKRMTENNPTRKPETRAKITARMNDPDVKAKFTGDNNPATRPEVQAKIRAKWAEPGYKEAMAAKRKGKPIHSDAEKEKRRQALLDPNHPMRNAHIKLNTDPDIKAKRVAALRTPEVQARISASLKLAWAKRKGLTGLP